MILPKIPLKSICQRFVTSRSIAYPSQKFTWTNSEFRPTTNIFAFQDHNQNCLVCATLPKTSGWKRKCLSIAGPDQSKVDIKAVPQVDETARKNVLQIAIHVFTALDDVDDFFRAVINELSKEQLTLISLFIGKKITSAVKFLLLNWKANTKKKKKIISGTTTYTNSFLIPAQILSLI